MKKILELLSIYALVFLILAGGLWLFLLGRETITGLMRAFYVGNSLTRGYQAGFMDRMLTLLLGLGWLVLFVVAEELLRRSVGKGETLRLFARFMGVEGLLAGILDFLALVLLSGQGAFWSFRTGIVLLEFGLGILFVFLGWSRRSPWFYEKKRRPIQHSASGSNRPINS